MVLIDAIRILFFPALVAFAGASDLLTMTISNRVSLALAGGFVVAALLTGMVPVAIALHVAAGASVLVVAFVFFARGWIGGGDAKLAAAIALWLGFGQMLPFLLYASLLGGALTLLIVQFRLVALPAALARQEWAVRLHRSDAGIPYGIALAGAALIVYPDSIWMKPLGL
jgi:prepilin peptidase CpaA